MIAESLNSYINYYISQPEPGYAVLITGEWGIGKTYQVMKVLPEEQTCYISLFGINTTSEIYASVFTAMYPGRSFVKKSANALKESTAEINGLTLGAGVLFSSLADALIKQTVDNSKIIIFDDLERCPLTTKEILGAINKYIEHHKCRVIVIAHDIEIESEFIKTKEKIIGHTIKIQPQIESAAKSFFNETTKIKHHTNIKKSIINAFKESKCQSLRILRHVIKDCNRLISCLKYSQITNNEAMNELFSTFTLMNIEFRLNNILPEEIRTLEEQLSAVILELPDEDEDDKASNRLRRLTKLFNKYTQETFTGGLLDSELLYSMLVDGVYPKKIINENLEQSRYFKTNQNLPAWLQVQSFDYLDDHTVNSAVKQLINQFKTKEITELGTMLHMFHLMFLMSSINILAQSFDEVLLDCKQYVDDLVTINKLPFNYTDDDLYNSLDTSAHGHGFWLRDEYQHHINLLRAHIKSKQKEALEKNYLSFANEILNALENDVNEFRSLLIGDGNKLGKYSQIDILSSIPHEDFVLTWLCLPYYEWDKIRNILINRYSRGIAPHILAGEKDWLIAVTVTLKLEALKLQGFERLRIERLVPTRAFQHI